MRSDSSSRTDDTVGRIDRCLADRTFRLNAGIALAADFSKIDGCLMVASGRGKFLRIRHTASASIAVPTSIQNELNELDSNSTTISNVSPVLFELADVYSRVAEQLKIKAGKAVDRILTISIVEPGLWTADFDGHQSYFCLNDANRLAEQTGITIVDSFPSRDISAGGNGKHLNSLPMWVAFADRAAKVATTRRYVLELGDVSTIYDLPPSDGLDDELPGIKCTERIGLSFLSSLIDQPTKQSSLECDLTQLINESVANGQIIESLLNRWSNSEAPPSVAILPDSKEHKTEDLIRTGIEFVVDAICKMVVAKSANIVLFCEEPLFKPFAKSIQRRLPSSDVHLTNDMQSFGLGAKPSSVGAISAALMGFMHIDQLPANVPWITGASCQRILGRITPGRPSNWRQLVLDMADYCPPAMKLKDAV